MRDFLDARPRTTSGSGTSKRGSVSRRSSRWRATAASKARVHSLEQTEEQEAQRQGQQCEQGASGLAPQSRPDEREKLHSLSFVLWPDLYAEPFCGLRTQCRLPRWRSYTGRRSATRDETERVLRRQYDAHRAITGQKHAQIRGLVGRQARSPEGRIAAHVAAAGEPCRSCPTPDTNRAPARRTGGGQWRARIRKGGRSVTAFATKVVIGRRRAVTGQ